MKLPRRVNSTAQVFPPKDLGRDDPSTATFLLLGERLHEILKLTWDDIDFRRRNIRLHQTKTARFANTGEVRYVPLMPQLHAILLWYRRQCREWSRNSFLFRGRDGTRPPDDIRGCLAELIARAVIPSVVPVHFFRHTFAAMRCKTVEGGK